MNRLNQTNKKLLLHVCCAPDATVPIPELLKEGYDVSAYFYGSNIQPFNEYIKRADAVKFLAKREQVSLHIEDYAPEAWKLKAGCAKLEELGEGGARCGLCFALQLKGAAALGAKNAYTHLCTTLTISPHKNAVRINAIGENISRLFGLAWVNKIWRKNDQFKLSVQRSKELGLYRQSYCGCEYGMTKE